MARDTSYWTAGAALNAWREWRKQPAYAKADREQRRKMEREKLEQFRSCPGYDKYFPFTDAGKAQAQEAAEHMQKVTGFKCVVRECAPFLLGGIF